MNEGGGGWGWSAEKGKELSVVLFHALKIVDDMELRVIISVKEIR